MIEVIRDAVWQFIATEHDRPETALPKQHAATHSELVDVGCRAQQEVENRKQQSPDGNFDVGRWQ